MDFNNLHECNKGSYDLNNNKILLIAILCLSFVIVLVIILHIYARCVLRPPRRNGTAAFIHRDLAAQHLESTSAKPGLVLTLINLIPLFPYKVMDGEDDKSIECAVCLSLLEEDELARRLPNCNHVFHMECVDRWLSSQSTCPMCRSDVAPRLAPHDREPTVQSELSEASESEHDREIQVVVSSANNSSKVNSGNGSSSSPSFRISSFRKIIGRDRSSSSSRSIPVCGEIDIERQVQQ